MQWWRRRRSAGRGEFEAGECRRPYLHLHRRTRLFFLLLSIFFGEAERREHCRAERCTVLQRTGDAGDIVRSSGALEGCGNGLDKTLQHSAVFLAKCVGLCGKYSRAVQSLFRPGAPERRAWSECRERGNSGGSTRSSVSASSQRNIVPLRTHSPENPDPTCRVAPTGGALGPELARQVIILVSPDIVSALSFERAMAAPEARSRDCERAAINARTASTSVPSDSASRLYRRSGGERVGVVWRTTECSVATLGGVDRRGGIGSRSHRVEKQPLAQTLQRGIGQGRQAEADTSGGIGPDYAGGG